MTGVKFCHLHLNKAFALSGGCQWHLYFYCHAINLLIVWLKKRCFWILNSVIITTCEIPHFVYQWHLYFCRSFWTKWRITSFVVTMTCKIPHFVSEWQGKILSFPFKIKVFFYQGVRNDIFYCHSGVCQNPSYFLVIRHWSLVISKNTND